MHKIPKELLDQVLNTIALAIHPNKSYLEVNQLIQKLNQLEKIETTLEKVEIKEEVKEEK